VNPMLQDVPRQIWLTLGVEAVLVTLTLVLLSEPGYLIKARGPGLKKVLRSGGLVFLCLTFFWSFILGHLIAIFHLTRQSRLGEGL
jgi:hypothetical protein